MQRLQAHLSLAEKSRLARGLTLTTLLLLCLLMTLESLRSAPAATPLPAYALVIGLKTVPLLCFLPGLLQARAMAGVWLALLLLPYFCLTVLSAWAPGIAGLLGVAESVLIASCFATALLFTRWQRALAATV